MQLSHPGAARPVELGWDDLAHWHPHTLRWSEADLLCRAVALADPTDGTWHCSAASPRYARRPTPRSPCRCCARRSPSRRGSTATSVAPTPTSARSARAGSRTNPPGGGARTRTGTPPTPAIRTPGMGDLYVDAHPGRTRLPVRRTGHSGGPGARPLRGPARTALGGRGAGPGGGRGVRRPAHGRTLGGPGRRPAGRGLRGPGDPGRVGTRCGRW